METRKQSLEQFQQNTNETLEKLTAMFHKLVTDVRNIKEKDSTNLPLGKGITIGNEGKPYLKLHFPRFSGDDPTGGYFEPNNILNFGTSPIRIVSILPLFILTVLPYAWHRWFAKSRGPMTWREFTTALSSRLARPIKMTLRIPSSTQTYHHSGPKEEIRLEVKLKKPRTMTDAMGLSRVGRGEIELATAGYFVYSGYRFNSLPKGPHSLEY
ncbi:hypothetical protein ACSQ67_004509 [Phaseolus vulgaris]